MQPVPYIPWIGLQLDTEKFLFILEQLQLSGKWKPYLWSPYGERKGLIRLKLEGSELQHSPLTAVYYVLTGIEIMNSFLVPEMTDHCGFRSDLVVDISYASDACDVSRHYDRKLRNELLRALGLKVEQVDC